MKKLIYLIVLALILGLVLTGCLLSNVGQVPSSEQSGITYLTKSLPLTDLVGLWHFDEGVGTIASDSSGNGNTGTLTNMNTATCWVLGKFGNALSFDGMNGYVDCEKNGDIITAITIEAWIKPSAFTDYDAIITNFEWRDVSKQQGWSFRVMSDGKLVWRAVLSGDDCYIITSKSAMEANNWYHIVLTHDANYTRLYINGSLDKEETPSGTIVNLGKALKIGYDDFAKDRVFNGLIDEVRIWKVALSQDQLGFYGFDGLLPPYVETKAFKIGSSIPLKWHYTDLVGIVVDSSLAIPRVRIVATGALPPEVTEDAIIVDDPGKSGLRYDSTTDMWIFNWQTKEGFTAGTTYNIWITSVQTGQTNGPFPIQLR